MAVPGKKLSQKLSSTLSRGGAEDFDIFCDQCDRDDIRLSAFGYCVDCEEHLCQTCFNTHRRPKPLRHHQLLDKDHMPHTQILNKSSKSTFGQQDGDVSMPCTKHTKEVIKFFCHDHNTLICSVCVTLEHTPTSCHVDYIPDISGQILDSTEHKETLKDIDKLTYKCCQITEDLKQRVARSKTSLKDALVEIENFRREINKRSDELEKEVRGTATKIKHDNNKKLKTTETTCDDINKSLQASADTIKHLNTNKKADQLFTEMKIAQQLILHDENIITQLSTTTDFDEYTFESNQAIKKLLQNEKSLGTLIKKELKQPAQPMKIDLVPVKMTIARNINVKTSSDTDNCWISGIVVSENQLFVADYNNDSIKMIDIKSGTIKQLLLESQPWDITIVTRDTLAVTLPNIHIIQFISFSSNSFTLKSKQEVDGNCHGISHHQGKLAVTFLSSPKLQIMDLKGNIKITVKKDSNGDRIFIDPWYVAADNSSICVSDKGKEEIIVFDWQGEIKRKHAHIGIPMGISLVDDEGFLVGDRKGKRIYLSIYHGEPKLIIGENIKYIQAVCLCDETGTFFVSAYKYIRSNSDNYITLYEI